MTKNLREAAPIGSLLGCSGETVGWIYRWNNSELSVLLLSEDYVPKSVELTPKPGSQVDIDRATKEDINKLLKTLHNDCEED